MCVCFALCRVYMTQNRREEALGQCEKALQLLKDCGQPEKMISVYRDMAAVEHDSGHLDRAVEHLSKASSASRAQHTELLSNIYKHMRAFTRYAVVSHLFICDMTYLTWVFLLGSCRCYESQSRGAGGGSNLPQPGAHPFCCSRVQSEW